MTLYIKYYGISLRPSSTAAAARYATKYVLSKSQNVSRLCHICVRARVCNVHSLSLYLHTGAKRDLHIHKRLGGLGEAGRAARGEWDDAHSQRSAVCVIRLTHLSEPRALATRTRERTQCVSYDTGRGFLIKKISCDSNAFGGLCECVPCRGLCLRFVSVSVCARAPNEQIHRVWHIN